MRSASIWWVKHFFNQYRFGYLNAETYKFNSKLDQSLQGSSKFVKINIQNRPQEYDQDMLEESVPIGDLVETWDEREFDSKSKLQASAQKVKENKFISHSKQVQQIDDEVDEDYNLDDFDREESALKHTNKPKNEAQWQKHKDLLEARNMLAQAMNDAAFLIKNEEDINKLAHQSHKEGQMRQVNDINKELDMIEKMIHDDNESNVKRKPMENSVSSIKSSKKNSILESSKDPFDKLEELGKELNQEEIESMRKTAKTNKNHKRKPWLTNDHSNPPNRTDYNKRVLDDEDQIEEQQDMHSSLNVLNTNKTAQNLDEDDGN